jgi:DNA primase
MAVFGEHLWSGETDSVVVSEGAINALSAGRALEFGIDVAGLFGSHVKPGQILKLSRYRHVYILEDPDPTGREYAKELGGALHGAGVSTHIVRMPNGKDPNDQDPSVLRAEIERVISEVRNAAA